MGKFEANKALFADSALKEFEDLKLGHRFRFKNGLYEVTHITFEIRHDEPHIILAKVLDTKVSESTSNIIKVPLSKLRNSNSFDRYNKMVDKAYDIVF